MRSLTGLAGFNDATTRTCIYERRHLCSAGSDLTSQDSAAQGSVDTNASDAARAGRAARAGTKVGRLLRLLRIVRVLKLFLAARKRKHEQVRACACMSMGDRA